MSQKQISIESISLDIDSPDLKIKALDIEFKKISIFIGKNGSGKTLLFKMLYAMNQIANLHLYNESLPKGATINDLALYPIKTCIRDINFDFSMGIRYSNTSTLDVRFKDGKVVACTASLVKDHEYVKMKFLSSKMRLFSAADMYLSFRALHDPSNPKQLTPEIMSKLTETYDLFDIDAIENYIIRSPIDVSQIDYICYDDTPEGTPKIKPQTITVDLQNKSFNVTFDNGVTRKLQTLAAGEQAVIMMTTLGII